MDLILANILPILLGAVYLGREVVAYFGKKKAFKQGYEAAINQVNEITIQSYKDAKAIKEANEKLSDDDLDDALAGGMYKQKNAN